MAKYQTAYLNQELKEANKRMLNKINTAKEKYQAFKADTIHKMNMEPETGLTAVK